MKIVLSDILSGVGLTKINNNFKNIQDELNNRVLYRDNPVGEPNAVKNSIDMNGNRVYNLGAPVNPTDAARLQDVINSIASIKPASLIPFTPYKDITSVFVQGAIQELKDDIEAANLSKNSVSPDDFGATGSSVFPGDTIAVQAAFDDGRPVVFKRNHYVDNVVISRLGSNINFNGYSLIGCTTYSPDYLLKISGRELTLSNIKVNANFKSYTSVIRWASDSAGAPAQYNKVFGMHIMYGINGLTFGQVVGSSAVNAAQSENVIFGLTFRGVQTCWTGNQPNGFMTLVAPVLDCNPYEWTSQPGFNSTSWGANSRCYKNPLCVLTILGGEILKTFSQSGYGFEGSGVTTIGTQYEIASSWGLLSGSSTIKDGGGYMSGDSVPTFKSTVDSGNSNLCLNNFNIQRGAGVGVGSGAYFLDSTDNSSFKLSITDSKFEEWKINFLANGCVFSLKNVYFGFHNDTFSTDTPNILQGLSPYGNEIPTDGSPCYSWTISNLFGTGSPTVKVVSTTAMQGAFNAIQLTSSAGSTDFNTRFYRVPAGKFLMLSFKSLKVSGTGVIRWNIRFYDENRAIVGADNSAVLSSSTTVPSLFSAIYNIPTNAAWMRIEPNLETTSVALLTDLTAKAVGVNYLPSENIYKDAAPTSGVWMKGETVKVINPSAAGYCGYICTVGGSPGTWKGYGLIQA